MSLHTNQSATNLIVFLSVRRIECRFLRPDRVTCLGFRGNFMKLLDFVSIQASALSRPRHLPVSNVVGPVKIGSTVRRQRVNSWKRVSRAIGTCHKKHCCRRTNFLRSKSVQPFEHKERKSQNTCHGHVPYSTKCAATDLAIFPPLS